jgi:hypothetical protein
MYLHALQEKERGKFPFVLVSKIIPYFTSLNWNSSAHTTSNQRDNHFLLLRQSWAPVNLPGSPRATIITGPHLYDIDNRKAIQQAIAEASVNNLTRSGVNMFPPGFVEKFGHERAERATFTIRTVLDTSKQIPNTFHDSMSIHKLSVMLHAKFLKEFLSEVDELKGKYL